jgi:hypothetical protein
LTHAAVVNYEHTEAKAQIVGFRKRPKLPPKPLPRPQKNKIEKGGPTAELQWASGICSHKS